MGWTPRRAQRRPFSFRHSFPHPKQRAIGYMIKGVARRADFTGEVSARWLRHAHGSLDRGAPLTRRPFSIERSPRPRQR